jgi:pimeloyl-ACP methyl ester carboxylesterase
MSQAARRRRPAFSSRRVAIENFRSKPPLDVFTDEALDAYLDGGFAEQPDGSVVLRCRPEHEARVFEMGGQHDGFDHLAEVRCPVTVVRGQIEPGPASFADAVAERLPAGRLEVHDELGHFGPQQAPAAMARSIRAALRLPGGATGNVT